MLEVIGVKSVDELIAQTMPADILLEEPLDLDEPLTEQEHLNTMHQMAAKNQLYLVLFSKSKIAAGLIAYPI